MSGTEPQQQQPLQPLRRRRRAVGPAGARPLGEEARLGLDEPVEAGVPDDDERLRSDRPPHHDRGI